MAQPKATTKNIWDRVVALSVAVGTWGNRRKVRSSQIDTDADREWISVSKRLVESEELKAITAYDRAFNEWIKSRTVPSLLRSGVWLVPIESLEAVDNRVEEYREGRKALVEVFVGTYERHVDEARQSLGSLFDAGDYPSAEEVADTFHVRPHYLEFGPPRALSRMRAGIAQREAQRMQAHWDNAIESCKGLLRQTMLALLEHATERLTPGKDGKAKRFKRATLDNLMDFVDTFSERNIADDEGLSAVVERVRSLADGVTADQLRSDDSLRDSVRAGLDTAREAVNQMVEEAPSRAFSLDGD